ncbi:polysaccharide deacetylase family protein [Planktothrix sp. FACHB-1365]|uniref:polysaccharide deacetylase family protein n=1 Tax=Planktothrix sp. FACHB-1365 TaxID=2692855 RepID=UPI00168A2287|nr:polysaccharide deacetylase family protein [Planktothrix sp. FACHB-1365]MBD2483827.1 polysaccharide deacetylase family protein [Planktothrix sp. FACHB-1365]
MIQSIDSGNPNIDQIALTFDDGPHSEHTLNLLAVLNQHGVKATFFLLGENINGHESIVKQIVQEGHLIANHSKSHPDLLKCDDHTVLEQLTYTNTVIENITGKAPAYFRPPYGETDDRVNNLAGSLGLTPIMWSLDTNDWKGLGVDAIEKELMKATPGSIILCHDGVPASNQTIEAVNIAIPKLQQQGLNFVTLSELLVGGGQTEYPSADSPINIPHSSIPPIAQPVPGQKYAVQPEDDLSKIAEKSYGDGNEQSWRKIYEANINIIGSDPSIIKIGMVLDIP